MYLTNEQKNANMRFFREVFAKLREDGLYIWPAEQQVYIKRNDVMECDRQAYNIMKEHVPRLFMRMFKVVNN